MKVTIGVDVGGTFTDVVLVDADGGIHASKVVTTPHDPRDGVRHGVEVALATAGLSGGAVERFVHGTTLATNVLLERRGARTAFVTTAGFGDLLRLGRSTRVGEDRYDLLFAPPSPPVDDDMTFEVRERMTAAGTVHVSLTAEHIAGVVARIAETKPEAVAICFLHAYANPAHEQAFAEACRAAMPGVFVVASAEAWPEMREFERATTALACAYVGPAMTSYLTGLQEMLREIDVVCPVQIMDSSGGVLTAARAAKRPVATIESGGAAGVMAAGFVGRLLGERDVLSFDMGGTTAKAAVVRGGEPALTFDFTVGGPASSGGDRRNDGFVLKTPVVDLAEIGAGGGSLAWVDTGGALRVGPRSAGAVPGPACYGRGGAHPAVTDANLVLGYLRAGELSDGLVLSPELAAAAIDEHVAGPLGLSTVEAARAIHDIVNNNMVAAIRMVTIQRGIDPRDFTLVGFGGAGPIHLVRLAEAFGIRRVVVPWAAGVASALGLVAADPSVIEIGAHLVPADVADPASLTRVFDELTARAVDSLGVPAHEVQVQRVIEARHPGQVHQLAVEVPNGVLQRVDLDAAVDRFHDRYLAAYGIDLRTPVQFVTMRVRAVVPVDKPEPPRETPAAYQPTADGERSVFFGEHGEHRTVPVYRWENLRPGATLAGGAIVEGAATSVVVPPAWAATLDTMRNVVLTVA